ncbi:kyphoscoliosis peptidase [Clonorchis sinensis]|uniref:Kyphoscoliosis peptidase n=1 Tax=Clonorchis sinensis TaxID=79923 RepID=H2KPM4_CLOSI|nr:kyphoscoliosis peptidase [Clonorchis sinensis]
MSNPTMRRNVDPDVIIEAFSNLMDDKGNLHSDIQQNTSWTVQTQSAFDRRGFGPQALQYGRVDSPGQHSGSSHPELDSGCNGNGSVQYSQVSPPGSAISSVSTQRLPFYRQQYDQFSATAGGSPGYAPSGQFYRPDQSTANWSAGPIQQEPPKEFSLLPISTETYVEKPRPQDLPSIGDKSTAPFGSFDVFRRVDEHAVSISQQQQDSFKQLIWQLIYARNITDELEKVRVIFLWLCTKDLHKMNFDNVKPDTPEEILMGIRTGKSTYAQIFYTLCRYAGLHCKLLIGYAKGAEYAPGMQFSGRQGQHSWNAVLVDKVWRLVDCHWAARRLIGKRPSPENVRYGLDMFYFLANPGQLIYTHFPHDSDWQLLRHPITLKEFENLAPVKSAFFKYNLDLITHRNAVIVCTDPEVCVVIAFPPQAEKYLSFTFGLSIDNKEGSEEYRGLPLTRYGRQEISVVEHRSLFYVRPPRPGAYKLLIYAKHHQNGPAHQDNGAFDYSSDANSSSMYGAVCEYRLVANFHPNCSLPPYPPCQSSSYGPNELAKNYQIQAKQTQCTLRATRGCLEIRFALGSALGLPPPRMMGRLRCTLVPDEALTRSLLQRSVNGNREAVFAVFLPEAGEYGLEIYANNPAKDGNSFYVVWQYIILSDSESPVRGLPTIPPAYLGPMPRFDSMGLSTVSHPDPFIQANTGELCIQLNQNPDIPVRMMAQLIHASHDVSEDCSQQILQQMRDNQVYFVVRFPHPGFFKFQIYALPYSEPGESLPGVFNYLLEATQVHRNRSGQVMCFPQQFSQWKEGCYLHSPLDGILSPSAQPSDVIPFKLTVPKAIAVAVVVGDEWTHLNKVGDRWEGQVSLKQHWGREHQLAVCANYNTGNGNYGTILEYQVARR